MGKKSSSHTISTMPSATVPASSSNSYGSNRSSILKSCFSPSAFQLHLFATVIQSFESQQLRIHDVHANRLRQQHKPLPGTSITSLDWGHYGVAHKENGQIGHKKKRKRTEADAGNVVIGYGTSSSEICMYSPTENRVIGTLSGSHEKGIRDFKFVPANYSEAWSIGGDGKIVQWNLSNNQAIRSIILQDPATRVLGSPARYEPQIVCASTTPFSIYVSQDPKTESFSSFKGQVQTLIRSGESGTSRSELLLAADNDRYINVFDIVLRKLVRTLVVGSEVEHLDCSVFSKSETTTEAPVLAVVTKDGLIELFSDPFKLPAVANGDLRSSRKNITRKATAQVRLVSDNKNTSKIFTAALQGPDLIIVSVDGGVEPVFQKLRWQDEGTGELLFEGLKEIQKAKPLSALNAAQVNGVKNMGKPHVDESRTVVVNATGDLGLHETAIEISSGEDNDNEEEVESDEDSVIKIVDAQDENASSDADTDDEQATALISTAQNGSHDDVEMEDIEKEEPSFGDLLASRHPNMIAIADSSVTEKPSFDANKQIVLPSGMSLGTVLTQALRSNDKNLLESCLHANDVGIVQNTIQRLDSGLAINLLSKLAERLTSRPGRYGHLLSWVQWTCIAHGGVIASQPDVANKIRTLYKVLTQRSKSLDKLLLLKGKLDMLDAQLTLRKQIQARKGSQIRDSGEPGMVFIEGGEENWSSDDDDMGAKFGVDRSHQPKLLNRNAFQEFANIEASSEEDDDDDDAMPATNGVVSEEAEDSDLTSDAEVSRRTKGGIYDVEADVSGEDDSEDEGSEGDNGADSDDNDDTDEEEDDSSMDGFINDGEITYASEDNQPDLDDEQAVRKPEKKRKRHM